MRVGPRRSSCEQQHTEQTKLVKIMRKKFGIKVASAVFYLVVEQYALECAVNSLHIAFSSDLKVVFLWRQELLGRLLQESGALSGVEVTEVRHLVASDLSGETKTAFKRLFSASVTVEKKHQTDENQEFQTNVFLTWKT